MPEIVIGLIAGIAVFGGVLALGRLLAVSPRATLASVIGITIGLIALIAQWPGLLLTDVVVMLLLGLLADAVRRRTLYLAQDRPGWLTRAHLRLINSLRKAFNQPRIWLIPENHIGADRNVIGKRVRKRKAENKEKGPQLFPINRPHSATKHFSERHHSEQDRASTEKSEAFIIAWPLPLIPQKMRPTWASSNIRNARIQECEKARAIVAKTARSHSRHHKVAGLPHHEEE